MFCRLYHSESNTVLWIRSIGLTYWGSDSCLKDFGIINGLIKENKSFSISLGNKIGRKMNKRIFLTLEDTYNVFGFKDYTNVLSHVISQLELQGNVVCPNLRETMFWENKAFMHQEFAKINVSEPSTKLYSSYSELKSSDLKYPFLIKAEHSCSSNGLYKIDNLDELEQLMNTTEFLSENHIIIKQELINMRKDLRVIIVGNEIVLHYWRINLGKEWKPTSTSYGSDVDFVFFPEQWRAHILDTFDKLNLTTGAFDITWQNDDLNTVPLYLEVSPVFQPNPVLKLKGKPYSYYKSNITKELWDVKFVDIVFKIKHKEVQSYLSK